MAICARLKTFLGERGVRFEAIDHPLAYTASDIARTTHIGPRMLVKTVIVDVDGRPFMVTVAANQKVNLRKVAEVLGGRHARLEKESDLAGRFGDCEAGAMPPFGNLYGMKVIADQVLFMDREIAFNAGDHTTVVKMAFEDFERLVQPMEADITGDLDEDLYGR